MPLVALISFALGATSSAVLLTSKDTREKVRPYAKSALRKGIVAGLSIRRRAAGLVEDFEDLLADVTAEDSKSPNADGASAAASEVHPPKPEDHPDSGQSALNTKGVER